MKTRHFINLVEDLKGLQEDLMASIYVSYQAEMQYGWHSFVAACDLTNLIFGTKQSKQIS